MMLDATCAAEAGNRRDSEDHGDDDDGDGNDAVDGDEDEEQNGNEDKDEDADDGDDDGGADPPDCMISHDADDAGNHHNTCDDGV